MNVLDSLVVECAYNLFDTFLELCHQPAWGGGSAAYAYVAYQTAWLKCHYPCEFLAALLTSFLDNTGKVVQYINECARLGIKIWFDYWGYDVNHDWPWWRIQLPYFLQYFVRKEGE